MREKVKLKKDKECDVFVMGAGIAGIMAAIEASNNGQKVIISSSSNIFSGSSFYPGTWGLGLIGPEDRNDEEDLAKTIKEVGCNVVDEELVETFVKNINPSINLLKEMGLSLKKLIIQEKKNSFHVLIIKIEIGMVFYLKVQKKF